MKTLRRLTAAFFLPACIIMSARAGAQTATNWVATSCDGNPHELFADLDAGKVVVVIWVMPCASCIDEGLKAQSAVQEANSSNPGKVIYYVADDYGNSNCDLLEPWCSSNGITDAIILTDKKVSMGPYGEAGMPKVVVFGGTDHKVYYNQNGPHVEEADISAAINQALTVVTGLSRISTDDFVVNIIPNPLENGSVLSMNINSPSDLKIELLNTSGQVVRNVFQGRVEKGKKELELSSAEIASGVYFLRITNGKNLKTERVYINH